MLTNAELMVKIIEAVNRHPKKVTKVTFSDGSLSNETYITLFNGDLRCPFSSANIRSVDDIYTLFVEPAIDSLYEEEE